MNTKHTPGPRRVGLMSRKVERFIASRWACSIASADTWESISEQLHGACLLCITMGKSRDADLLAEAATQAAARAQLERTERYAAKYLAKSNGASS